MNQIGIHRVLGIAAAAVLLFAGGTAQSAVRYAGGSNGIINPSTTDSYELGPWRISEMVNTTGSNTASPLAVGQQITFAGGNTDPAVKTVFQTGPINRIFGPFVFVAQNTKTVTSTRPSPVVLSQGGGAGSPASIAFCPPIGDLNPLNGNLSCNLTGSAGAATYNIALKIAKTGNNNGFGGVYNLVRNVNAGVWFALSPFVPLMNTSLTQVVSFKDNDNTNTWPGGQDNFAINTAMGSKGPRYRALLTDVTGTADPLSTIHGGIGTLLNPGSPTAPIVSPPVTDLEWGFRLTTGVVSGSDMAPNATSFITTGKDTVTPSGNVRNLVLIGGGMATSQGSGTLALFNRNMVMKFSVVPEPGTLVALAVGVVGLAGLGRTRRRSD
jgi:hypothetical protein